MLITHWETIGLFLDEQMEHPPSYPTSPFSLLPFRRKKPTSPSHLLYFVSNLKEISGNKCLIVLKNIYQMNNSTEPKPMHARPTATLCTS